MMHILIIEDTTFWGVMLSKERSKLGVATDWVKNGKLGVEKIEQGSTDYNGIICDIQMPVMGGLEATRALRKLGFTKPIIGFSSVQEEHNAQCLEAGMNVCFEKSLDVERLQALFKSLGISVKKQTDKVKA